MLAQMQISVLSKKVWYEDHKEISLKLLGLVLVVCASLSLVFAAQIFSVVVSFVWCGFCFCTERVLHRQDRFSKC